MSLHYILDGYNIINSSGALLAGKTLEERRERLVSLVRDACPQGSARNTVTIVFDGRQENPFGGCGSRKELRAGGIEVVFSEGCSADEVIVETASLSRSPSLQVVVTNDKGIRRLLGGSGVRFMNVAEFCSRLSGFRRHGLRRNDGKVDAETAREIDRELEDKWL